MNITPGLVRSAKREFLTGVHQDVDTYRVALYGASARLGLQTKTYSPVGEVKGQGYTAGGIALSGYTSGEDATGGYIGWLEDAVWENASIDVCGALIYNASKGNRALHVTAFPESVKSVVGPWKFELSKTKGVLIRLP